MRRPIGRRRRVPADDDDDDDDDSDDDGQLWKLKKLKKRRNNGKEVVRSLYNTIQYKTCNAPYVTAWNVIHRRGMTRD